MRKTWMEVTKEQDYTDIHGEVVGRGFGIVSTDGTEISDVSGPFPTKEEAEDELAGLRAEMPVEEEEEERENDLILALCQEAGDDLQDTEAVLEGFRGNHRPELITKAAMGDVAALVRLREDVGLQIF